MPRGRSDESAAVGLDTPGTVQQVLAFGSSKADSRSAAGPRADRVRRSCVAAGAGPVPP
jgi:hypothetical protein